MRRLSLVLAALLLASCSAKQQTVSNNTPASSANQAGTSKAERSTEAKQTISAESGHPIDFNFLGITADKQNIAYRIKVNTAKPIEEVHLALKESDASGKSLMDTTLVWQNIVKSIRQPIESGNTYDVQDYLYPGATKVECSLKEVVFKDGTRSSGR